jgi:hypothetical protein
MLGVFGGLLLGVLLGLRHAFEPDHLAAVSTLVADRRNPRAGLLVGGLWGLGHTASLLAVGGSLSLLERRLTPSLEQCFECAVAAMLVVLGVRGLLLAAGKGVAGPTHLHLHGRHPHVHPASALGHVHLSRWTFAPRPLAIGLVHGLAGSGALTVLVLARMPTLAARLVYIGLFGLGSAAGMALLSGLAGLSLHFVRPSAEWTRALLGSTGTVSLSLGCWWGWASVQALLAV